MHILFDPVIPFLRIYPTDIQCWNKAIIIVLSVIVKTWKQSKCPSFGDRLYISVRQTIGQGFRMRASGQGRGSDSLCLPVDSDICIHLAGSELLLLLLVGSALTP